MRAISGDAFYEWSDNIASDVEFAEFADALVRNYREHPEEWENCSLGSFLEAIAGVASGLQGYCENWDVPFDLSRPGWPVFAHVLLTARGYE
jgi:hypothetical protein